MRTKHILLSIMLIFLISCHGRKEIDVSQEIIPLPPKKPIEIAPKRKKVDIKLDQAVKSTNIDSVSMYWPARMHQIQTGEINYSDLPKPKKFDISPSVANFIYSFLLGKVLTGQCGAKHIYFDDDSYYVSHLWPADNKFDDAHVMLDKGVRINGKDGTIYNRKTKKWEVKGYIHNNGDEIKKGLALGISPEEVNRKIGKHFHYRDYGSSSAMHFWAKDGEMVLQFKDNKLVKVDTKVKLGRH